MLDTCGGFEGNLTGEFMRTLNTLLLLVSAGHATAQLAHRGQPHGWGEHDALRADLPVIHVLGEDPQVLANTLATTGDFRYGVQRAVQIDVTEQGAWTDLQDGGAMCQVAVSSPGAVMLSLQFSEWAIPEGAEVFLYDRDRTMFIGAFRASNASPKGTMATSVIRGDQVVIEYRVPEGVRAGRLSVGSVTHGLVDVFRFADESGMRDIDPGYQSSPCHNNVVCPIAEAWQDQKRSVALFLRPDGNGCTGSLVNNTQVPGRPYFYMANHCYVPTESQWVFYFNYDSPTCVGNTGPSNQTLTGAVKRSNYYYDDFCLLELFDAPPAAYTPYYAGWDRSGAQPTSQTVIHHPLYDVKKISFDFQPATSYVDGEGIQMWRNYWDSGIVEPVSSGSPLFDQNKRVIGHMTEGAQNCSNSATVHTGCAKFSASWDGVSASTRLRDWLDPANTTMVLDGYDPFATPELCALNARVFLQGPYNTSLGRMNAALRSLPSFPLQEPYSALGFEHVLGGGEAVAPAVLNVNGANAIVDWVVVELRQANAPFTAVATRSALLQADGDVVDVDGTSALSFPVAPGSYRIAVHHRNHLPIITETGVALSAAPVLVDLSNGSTALQGGNLATAPLDGRRVMVSGDCTRDRVVRYTGLDNDRDAVLIRVGGTVPTNFVSGYYLEDNNLDGQVRYTGAGNDRDIILETVGGSVPTNTREAAFP